jgi:hypothetical protein
MATAHKSPMRATCPDGFCHLGGPAIPDREAYGAGLVDAARAVRAAGESDDRSGERAEDSGR